MSYLPEVAWSTIASNVTLGASAYRYYITVNPLDPNEAGASPMTVAINDWFIDFAGYPFLIEEVNGSILTVYDILERGDGVVSAYAPYANKLGYVYRPLNGAIILTQAQLRKLDESAKDIIQPIEKGIQWAYRGIRLVSVDDDYSNITRLDLTNNLKYTYTENGGWQGGHKAELDLNIGLGTGALAEMEYTNNGDGTITVQENTFMLYDNANGTGYPKPYLISGGTFSFTDNTYNYIVADYNSGTPIMYVITDVTLINETTIVPVFSVLRRGTILCLTNWNTLGNAKIDKLHQSIVKTQRYRRQSGLAISVPSTGTPRRVSITGGIVWIGAVPVDLNATISGDAGVYMFEYYKSSSTWTYTLVSQINNTYYQGTTDRVELTSNRYAVAFIFRGVEHCNNHIYLVYGTGDYTLSQAQASGQPSDLPVAINSHAILVGRVIIKKSSDTITEIASAFDKAFLIQPIDLHSGLSDLGWTVSGHTGTAGSVPVFNSSGVAVEASLTNGYVPYKTTNGLDNSLISIDGTDVTIGTLNGLLLGTSGVLSATSSLGITYGGTGITSYTQGDLLYYTSGDSLSKLNKSTSTNYYLKNSGVDNSPAWASITDSDLVLSDITTNNASSSKHGFLPKLPNDTSKWLRGDGSWATISTDYGNFLDSAIRMVVDNSFDPSPTTTGDRYILETTSLHTNFGTITGLGVHDIVQYNGSAFTVVFDASAAASPATVTVGIDKNGASNHDWTYNVTDDIWVDRGTTTLHNSLSDLNTGVGQYYHLTSEQHDLVAGITSTFTELNYLDGTTVTSGRILFGDGTKITNDSNLYWDYTNDRLSIGTTTPVYKFVVSGTNASPAHVGIIATDTSATYIRFGYSGEYNAGIAYQSTATGFLSLRTGGHTASEDRLVIKDTGISYFTNRLGIKRTLPICDLDVNGTTRIGTLNGLIKGTYGVLSAITSTESGTKYLRDDYTWQTVSGVHGNLTGLNVDDHKQYALLAGRTGDVLKIDNIEEYTINNGINIEGVTLKDSKVTAVTGQFTQSTGIAPFIVTSTTKVTNLNADKLDGYDYTAFSSSAMNTHLNSVISADTRDINYAPNERNKGLYIDFKSNVTDGLSDGATYHGVLTFRPYGSTNDMSGGYPHQLGFTHNGNLWYRIGNTITTWKDWHKFYHSGNSNLNTIDWTTKDLSVSGSATLGTLDGLIKGTSGVLSAITGTQGDILYYNGTTWTVLNAGTNGYFLKTQGSGANPVWSAVSGGTVTSVAAGNGMNFTTITNSGSVTLGTPSGLTSITTNSVTSNSHTHSIEIAHQTSTTSSSTPTPTGNYKENEYYLTALAAGATFAAPSGTPVNGNTLLIRIKDNGTARTLAWNSIYRAVGVTLPTTTTASKTLYIGCIYNSTDSKWDVVSVVKQA